jgi:peptidoglycan/xylan/chitin deacetylase (PgdA/CDA1 family)
MADPILVTSWDDGHPDDLRLAERLARLGIAATFFVPVHNSEGRAVMSPADWRALDAAGFELAAHTLDHVRLNSMPPAAAYRQMVEGRQRLEDALGHAVAGFAYPGGRVGRHGRQMAAEAGFTYARTTRMFCLSPGPDRLDMGTTAQFHPHTNAALLRNWLRQGAGRARLHLARRIMAAGGLAQRMALLAEAAATHPGGGVLHLWGHGWEIAGQGLWPVLEDTMARLADRFPPAQCLTVQALAARSASTSR